MSSSMTSVRSRRRSRSRGGSRAYSRSHSYSQSDSDAQYSDDTFFSDDDVSRRSVKPTKGKQLSRVHPYATKVNKKRSTLNKKSKILTPRSDNNIKQRMQSARRAKFNEIRNELEETRMQLQDLQQENKLLIRQQRLQDKAIMKFQAAENDLPQLMRRHSAELHMAKAQLRLQKERNRKLEHQLHDASDEQESTRKQLVRMKKLVEDKNLGERDELNRKLTKAEIELEDTGRKNAELQKHVENLKKNHRHEIGIERARHNETKQELSELKRKLDDVQLQLKEKEKVLDIKNIYSNRIMKPPHKLNSSVSSSPAIPQFRSRKHSDPLLNTSRTRAKQYEQQRREEHRLREEQQQEQEARRRADELYEEQQEAARRRAEQEEHDKELERLQACGDTAQEERLRREREQQEEQQRREDKKKRQEQQRREEQKKTEEQNRSEEKDRREKQRQEEEEQERQWREEREKRKREAEAYEKEQREKAERLAREKEEEERRLQAAAHQENHEERQKKDLLLARMRELDANKEGSGSRRGSTSLAFSKPVENMHHGLPAYESPVGRSRARHLGNDQSDDDITGYQPSFVPKSKRSAGSTGQFRQGKKSDLMTELFGASSTVKTSPVQQPQDDDQPFVTAINNSTVTRHHDTSTTLFGIGSAYLEDDVPVPHSQALLPRRGRQPATTIHTRSTINAIDGNDDDLEEVIL